ncbi:hypothetical protein SAMN02910369_02982 [Lachnospiraceae bacterium NE2001]|nr:hypothetical protein SAMN02910369_02982 [Lachnospiraceae bacterium NE2001]
MRKGRRIISTVVAAAMLFSLAGCGGSGDNTGDTTEAATESAAAVEDDADASTSNDAEGTDEDVTAESSEDAEGIPEGMQRITISKNVYGVEVQFLIPDYGWTNATDNYYYNQSHATLIAEGVGADNWNMKLNLNVDAISQQDIDRMIEDCEKYEKYTEYETSNDVTACKSADTFGISGNITGGAYVDDFVMHVHFSVSDADLATNHAEEHPETDEVAQSIVDTLTFTDTTGGTGIPSDAGGIIDYTASFKIPDNSISYNGGTLSATLKPWSLSDSAKRKLLVSTTDPDGNTLDFEYYDPYEPDMFPNIPTFESDWPYVEETIGGYTGYTRTKVMAGGQYTEMEFIFDGGNDFYYFTTVDSSDGESDMTEARAFLEAILSAAEFTAKDSRVLPEVTIE